MFSVFSQRILKTVMKVSLTQSQQLPLGKHCSAGRTQAKVTLNAMVERAPQLWSDDHGKISWLWIPLIPLWSYCKQICGVRIKTHVSRSTAGQVNSEGKPYSRKFTFDKNAKIIQLQVMTVVLSSGPNTKTNYDYE